MEIKKSYSPFGSTPLSVDEVLPDIQTGRAVYPDKDKEADASYMERINQYKHEGFHDVSEDSGSSSGGSVDCGYSCSEERVTLTDESVTTEAPTGVVNPVPQAFLSYSEPIEADTIKVTFDGTVYECEKKTAMGVYYCYGADVPTKPGGDFDWSQYPFAILSSQGNSILNTETAGTYQVKIEAFNETVETSECFEKAVKVAVGITGPLIVDVLTSSSIWQVPPNVTWQVIHDEYIKGRTILFQETAPTHPPQKKDAFGSVVGVVHDTSSSNYYIDVYVQGQLRRFSASDPNGRVTYQMAS